MIDPTSTAPFLLQSGTFQIGDSGSLVENVPFSAAETITLAGVTQTITIFGEDDVTSAYDTLLIYGSGPIWFGQYALTIAPFTISDEWVGDQDAVALEGSISQTPEPGSLLLLGTGVVGFGAVMVQRMRGGRGVAPGPVG